MKNIVTIGVPWHRKWFFSGTFETFMTPFLSGLAISGSLKKLHKLLSFHMNTLSYMVILKQFPL